MRSPLPCAMLFAALTCPQASSSQEGQRPNILLITVDTFRPDHLSYYGYPRETSPELDRFSGEGVFFRQAFTTSGWTAPGLISIHTSLYAPAHAVDVRGKSLDPGVTTLAEALRGAGYRAPDIFFLTDIPNFKHLGFEPYSDRNKHLKHGDEILFRWLRDEAAVSPSTDSTGAATAPFFLYYHYRDLHQPYAPGSAYEALYTPASFGPQVQSTDLCQESHRAREDGSGADPGHAATRDHGFLAHRPALGRGPATTARFAVSTMSFSGACDRRSTTSG